MNILMPMWKCQGSLAGNVGRIGEEAEIEIRQFANRYSLIKN